MNAQTTEDSLLHQLEIAPEGISKVEALIGLTHYYADRDMLEVREYAEQAFQLSQTLNYEHGIAKSIHGIASYHDHFGEYDLALDHYLKSLKIFEKLNDSINISSLYLSIGVFFRKQKNYAKALEYYQKSNAIESKIDHFECLAANYNNIGNVYSDLNKIDSAMIYYRRSLELYQQTGTDHQAAAIKVNLGIQYEEKGDYVKAEKFYMEALEISRAEKDLQDEMIALTNIGFLYIKKKQYAKSADYFSKAKDLCEQLNDINWKTNIYEGLSQLEENRGNFESALRWNQKLLTLKDSIFNIEQKAVIEKMQARFELEQKEKEIIRLNKEKEIQQQKRLALMVIMVLSLLLGIILFIWQRSKLFKERKIAEQQEKILISENRKLELEQEKIKSELAFRDKELTTFALHLVQKNEFLKHIEEVLQKVPSANSNTQKALKKVSFELHQNQLIGNELADFHIRLDEVNSQFFQHLESKFPQLTKKEKRLAALLRLGLTSKEISVLNHVGEQAIKMSRHRLRKRLSLDSSVNLTNFFKNLEV